MQPQAESRGDLVAAVDLGSNSFHMVIARQTGHDLQILDRGSYRASLTPAGEALYRQARRVLQQAETFSTTARRYWW